MAIHGPRLSAQRGYRHVVVLEGRKLVQVAAAAPLDEVRTLIELYLERL